VQRVSLPQLAFPLGGLLRQDMTAVRMITLEAARGGPLETLRSTTIGFNLGHLSSPVGELWGLLLFLRRQSHDHLPAFHLGMLLDRGMFRQISLDSLQ
jgi:hypothetical protein